jgi:two-component system phosphate regulon response regulator PhoB
MAATILVVDDENDLVAAVEYALQREGFRTISAGTARDALVAAAREPSPDLVLLDLMLPDGSGTEVCRQLRARESTKQVPIVMLTARDDEIDRVVGFEVGADDYIGKPFSVRELVLRIRAILRRTDRVVPEPGDLIDFGCMRVDTAGHRVWVEDSEVHLTALEYKLLHTFLSRRGRVQTRDTLLQDVWGHLASLPTRTIDTHVQRLRKKLGAASDYISTLRGVGYRFRTVPDVAED